MFKRFFKRAKPADNHRPDINLTLRYLGVSDNGVGVKIAWSCDTAPAGAVFDFDFAGQPSGITTGFVWDMAQDSLDGVFRVDGDTAFKVRSGWAYAGVHDDNSGNVDAVWMLFSAGADALAFETGAQVTVALRFDPDQTQVRVIP